MLGITSLLKKLGYVSVVWTVPNLAIVGIGLAAAPFCIFPGLREHARLVGCVVGYCVTLTFLLTATVAPNELPGAVPVVPQNILLVMLVGIAALPLRPLQALALGSSTWVSYVTATALCPETLFIPDVTPLLLTSLIVSIFICTALTAVVYHQRDSAFQARQQVWRAQARLTLSESAAAQGRLAAALSHELNSPIGVLGSIVDTLSLVLEKCRNGAQSIAGAMEILRDVETTARRSCRRLREVVDRMQRFTHLDRAEETAVDINAILEDTLDILKPELQEKAEVATELEPLPLIRCRPQQMTAVFSNLLLNSTKAIDERGTIRVRSAESQGEVVVEVEDNGREIPPEKLVHIFEPSFAVAGGRVTTANWGLFNCRNIITGLGGDIQIESAQGAGTKVRIVLPSGSG
jgi:signal transduction histidine kinase